MKCAVLSVHSSVQHLAPVKYLVTFESQEWLMREAVVYRPCPMDLEGHVDRGDMPSPMDFWRTLDLTIFN